MNDEAKQPGTLAAGEVRAMFDRIAGVYDLMNSAMTAGLHHRWRARAADLAGLAPGGVVLDVASGTGDLALELARRVSPGGAVVGCDFAEAMLERARAKAAARARAGAHPGHTVSPRFEWADAMALPYADGSFDAATVGFGARNFADLARGLAEMARVVRPGGRVVVLEITTPTKPPLSLFYRLWFDRVVPALGVLAGALAARSRPRSRAGAGAAAGANGARAGAIAQAYDYLPSSVKRFPGPEELAAELERAGLAHVRYLLTAGGIVAIHAGTVPRRTAAAAGGRAS
ncbi:MAG TPA: ubiquinone/menaquinone biosynthesis methyltransferase [Solirubrobacteraceae bacterium]|nr:ubiquinone/menaquinone biosynthesis methyltransferase [Solirubrobacteraceae bacterium]